MLLTSVQKIFRSLVATVSRIRTQAFPHTHIPLPSQRRGRQSTASEKPGLEPSDDPADAPFVLVNDSEGWQDPGGRGTGGHTGARRDVLIVPGK